MRQSEEQVFERNDIEWAIEPDEDGPFKRKDLYLIFEFSGAIYTHYSVSQVPNVFHQPSYNKIKLNSKQYYSPSFKYLHVNQINLLRSMLKGPVSFTERNVFFIRLDDIDDSIFNELFIDSQKKNKLKTGENIKNIFQKNIYQLDFMVYRVPTPYKNRFTIIDAVSNNSINFFDHTVHCQPKTPIDKIKKIHSQISRIYIQDFNLNIVKEKIKIDKVKQIMKAIPSHINSIILKGKVSARKIIPNLPKNIHEIILSDRFELEGSLSFFVKNIPESVQQLGIEADTQDIKKILDYFSIADNGSDIRAIRLLEGITESVIKKIPKQFKTIYITPNIYISRDWLNFVLNNLKLLDRDYLLISYPIGINEFDLFQDKMPFHLMNSKIFFIQHLAPEHTPIFIEDKPFHLYSQLLLMPGVRKKVVKVFQKTYTHTEFSVMIYPGLDPDILKILSFNFRNLIFCLSGKKKENKTLLKSIPSNFIHRVDFCKGSDRETIDAINHESLSDCLTISISEMTDVEAMKAFFLRLNNELKNKIVIECIEVSPSKENKKILKEIPEELVSGSEFRISDIDTEVFKRLKTKVSKLTFAFMPIPLPIDTRDKRYEKLILGLKKFPYLQEINFYDKINFQILQGVASIPSIKKISLYKEIKEDNNYIEKFINVLNVIKNIDELIFYNNEDFCEKLMHDKNLKNKELEFKIFSDEKRIYPINKKSKKRKMEHFDNINIPSSKRQKLSINLFSEKSGERKDVFDEESDENNNSISNEMKDAVERFINS